MPVQKNIQQVSIAPITSHQACWQTATGEARKTEEALRTENSRNKCYTVHTVRTNSCTCTHTILVRDRGSALESSNMSVSFKFKSEHEFVDHTLEPGTSSIDVASLKQVIAQRKQNGSMGAFAFKLRNEKTGEGGFFKVFPARFY